MEKQSLREKMGAWLCKLMGHWICPHESELIEFALDGLDGADRERARKHLGHCRHCRDQVRDFLLMNAGLALNVPESAPPQGLEESILSRVRQTCNCQPASETPVLNRAEVKGSRWQGFWAVAGPVFALIALGLALVVARARDDFEGMLQIHSKLRNSLETKAGREERILAMLCSPSLVTVGLNPMAAAALSGAPEGQEAAPMPGEPVWARLFVVEGENKALLFCRSIGTSRPGESYFLWSFTQQEGSPKKYCGQFKVPSASLERIWIDLADNLDLKRRDLCFGVTREKAGGDTAAPQGDLLLLGKVKP